MQYQYYVVTEEESCWIIPVAIDGLHDYLGDNKGQQKYCGLLE